MGIGRGRATESEDTRDFAGESTMSKVALEDDLEGVSTTTRVVFLDGDEGPDLDEDAIAFVAMIVRECSDFQSVMRMW